MLMLTITLSLKEPTWRQDENCFSVLSTTKIDTTIRTQVWFTTGWSKSHVARIKIFIDCCSSVKFDRINGYTISLWLYKSPRWSYHVICSSQSISCLETVKMQVSFFHKCDECRKLPGVSFLLVRISSGMHFPILLYKTNRHCFVWWTVSGHCSLFAGLHQTWVKEWKQTSLNAAAILILYMTQLIFVFLFQCLYFLTNRTCFKNGLHDFLTSPYNLNVNVWTGFRKTQVNI